MTTIDRLARLDQRAQQADQEVAAAYRAAQERIDREQAEKNEIANAEAKRQQIEVERLLAAREEGAAKLNNAVTGELSQLWQAALTATHAGQIEVAEQHVAKYRELAARINVQYVDQANRFLGGALDLLANAARDKARREGKNEWDMDVAAAQAQHPYRALQLSHVDTIEQFFSKWVLAAPVNTRERRIRIGLTYAALGTTTGDPGVDRRLGLA